MVKSECMKRLRRHSCVQNNDSKVMKARAETSSAERVDELNDLKDQKEQSRKGVLQRRVPNPRKQGRCPTLQEGA